MIRITFSEADRAKFGLDGDIPYDANLLTNKEVRLIQSQVGFSPKQWHEALNKNDQTAQDVLVWVALLRAGHKISFDDLEYNMFDCSFKDDEADASPGKDQSTPEMTSD